MSTKITKNGNPFYKLQS